MKETNAIKENIYNTSDYLLSLRIEFHQQPYIPRYIYKEYTIINTNNLCRVNYGEFELVYNSPLSIYLYSCKLAALLIRFFKYYYYLDFMYSRYVLILGRVLRVVIK